MVIHIYNLTSLGVEQVTLKGNFRFQQNKDITFRAPWPLMKKRPDNLTSDITRLSGGKNDG